MSVFSLSLHGELLGDLLQRSALGLRDEEKHEDEEDEAHYGVAEDHIGQANLFCRAREGLAITTTGVTGVRAQSLSSFHSLMSYLIKGNKIPKQYVQQY